jgi:hypothetical protein
MKTISLILWCALVPAQAGDERTGGGAAPSRDPSHWAFQPAAEQPVPHVKSDAWPQSALDGLNSLS